MKEFLVSEVWHDWHTAKYTEEQIRKRFELGDEPHTDAELADMAHEMFRDDPPPGNSGEGDWSDEPIFKVREASDQAWQEVEEDPFDDTLLRMMGFVKEVAS